MVYASGVSDRVIELCNAQETIASSLAKQPDRAAHRVWQQLYPKPFVLKRLVNRFLIKHDLYYGRGDPTEHDLDRAARCGKFPYRPSDLFLKIFSDVLLCLERDPLAGVCSPPLLGTSGVMPLTIISVIPDIMQHYYDCIVRAEQEVILATNYWQPSNSVNKIGDGLRELSRRVGSRTRPGSASTKLVVKIMWDRGTFSQLWENHAPVNQEGREALKLPKLEEIPNLDLEVINFHRPLMGTFHAKFLIVDRKVALLNSNNIQDRPNLEMMIHLEGPVVESFYDVFLYSWHHRLAPVLPCLSTPPPTPTDPNKKQTAADFRFREGNPYLSDIELVKASKAARAMLTRERKDDEQIAKLRGEQHAQDHGFHPQARIQAVFGAFSESRRGSFSDDEERPTSLKREPTIRFADAVFQAMDRRRKSFSAGRSLSPTNTTSGPTSIPASHATPSSPNGKATAVQLPFSRQSTAPIPTHVDNFSTAVAQVAPGPSDQASTSNGRSDADIPHILPQLNLPPPSLHVPGATPGSRTPADEAPQIALQRSGISNDMAHAEDIPAGNGVHERNSAAYPVQANTTTGVPVPSKPVSIGPGDASATAAASGQTQNYEAPLGSAQLGITNGDNGHGIDQQASVMTNGANGAGHDQVASESAYPVMPAMHVKSNGDVREPTSVNESPKDSEGQPSTPKRDGAAPESPQGTQLSPGKKTLSSNSTGNLSQKKSKIGGLGLGSSRSRSNSVKAAAATGPPGDHTPRQRALSSVLNAGALSEAWSAIDDSDLLDEFNPHTLHHAHDPFPIAMVNRKPHGLPGHQDIRVPQDAAWLAGFRYAQKSVFIQTPTFNAKPIIRAALAACRRGIQVTIYVDLGFNDKGESMPFQGGTNEEVVERMYKDLNSTGHQKNLHVFWYVGKDQVRPLNAVKKQRNCHVKFMQIDDSVGIQGNGNQDTQSWYHSCEINVMVDSKEIVADWMAAIHRQQNTQLYGRVDDDGIWRDRATGRTPAQMEEWENEQKRLSAAAVGLNGNGGGSGGDASRSSASVNNVAVDKKTANTSTVGEADKVQ